MRASDGHVEMIVEVNGQLAIASASHCSRTGEVGEYYDNANTFDAFRFVGSRGGGGAAANRATVVMEPW